MAALKLCFGARARVGFGATRAVRAAQVERPMSVQLSDVWGGTQGRAKRADSRRSRHCNGTAGVDLDDLAGRSLGRLGSGHITTIGHIDVQPSPSRRRRFALLAGLGAADDLTRRRGENWPTGTGAAITGTASDRRRADTVALACAFRIPAEGFAVAGFAADLVGAATVFFAADRGAIVSF